MTKRDLGLCAAQQSSYRDIFIVLAYIAGVVLAISTHSLVRLAGLFVVLLLLQGYVRPALGSFVKVMLCALPVLLLISFLQLIGMPQMPSASVASALGGSASAAGGGSSVAATSAPSLAGGSTLGSISLVERFLPSVAKLTLRMYDLILLSFSLSQLLTPLRLSRALLSLCAPLRGIIPLEEIALSLSLALSMIPRLMRAYKSIQQAHFALHLPHRGMRAFLRTLPPLVARTLEEARELEDVLSIRRKKCD